MLLSPNFITQRDFLAWLALTSAVYLIILFAPIGSIKNIARLDQFGFSPDPEFSYLESFQRSPLGFQWNVDHCPRPIVSPGPIDISRALTLPTTSIVAHAPGWTIFRNLYMSNGTLFLLSDASFSDNDTREASFPEFRYMTSTGLPGFATEKSVAEREPTKQNMDVISSQEAIRRWGADISGGGRHRVQSIEGNTLLFNDPDQHLPHYYHFVAELLLGTWAFWTGAFQVSGQRTPPPSINRAIFTHVTSAGWHDRPGINAYFFRAAFPSITVEVKGDWEDRIAVTQGSPTSLEKAWHFPIVLLADRSAAFRGEACGSRTQRTAAEAWEYMTKRGRLDLAGNWWSSVQTRVTSFAGVYDQDLDSRAPVSQDAHVSKSTPFDDVSICGAGSSAKTPYLEEPRMSLAEVQHAQVVAAEAIPAPNPIVITYISRQNSRRRLVEKDHLALVAALKDLVALNGPTWELNIVEAEKLSKDQQIQIAARTTVMLGVHGNGLTHLVLMRPTSVSAVIEIFYPGGFARDYEWTARAVGLKHFSVWNNTYTTFPNEPSTPSFPEGFQGNAIPVHGPTITQLILDRVGGRL
ncbi:hypothetical protein HGRIS_002292 [Hohenbuehelia grisea]|uniref:Glycosyltransferase 61 catalytic domain-containing protein n=1 Tax=Hohenbuehelia grisea TaxID=104357 RepID=A0ABR3JLY1_9AGAR